MKIAFLEITATRSFGGIQTGVWNFAHEFARAGHDVTVIGGHGSVQNPFDNPVRTLTFPFISRERFPSAGFGFAFHKFAERLSLAASGARAALARGAFDWVLLHKPLDFFWAWLPGIRRPTRFALMSGGTDFMPFDRRLGRRVSRLFGCSVFNAWQLQDHFHRQPIVAYYGVDTDRFAPRAEPAEAERRAGSAAVVFGFAGRMVDWKGLDIALRALATPVLEKVSVRLVLAGDGPERPKLAQLSKDLGVASRAEFPGPLPHSAVAEFYRSCDATVFPSIGDEAFGLSIAEAMSCAVPAIGSYLGGIPEVIGNEGLCGRLVPPADPHALALAMREFARSPELRFETGRRARERICGNYTWPRCADHVLRVLSSVAVRPGSPDSTPSSPSVGRLAAA